MGKERTHPTSWCLPAEAAEGTTDCRRTSRLAGRGVDGKEDVRAAKGLLERELQLLGMGKEEKIEENGHRFWWHSGGGDPSAGDAQRWGGGSHWEEKILRGDRV